MNLQFKYNNKKALYIAIFDLYKAYSLIDLPRSYSNPEILGGRIVLRLLRA